MLKIDLVKEFEITRKMSKKYKNADYIVYTHNKDRLHLEKFCLYENLNMNKNIEVVVDKLTTECALLKYYKNNKIALLNFADAYEPGGLVLSGETTQEECLCRSSNMYETITNTHLLENFYEYNKIYNGRGKGSEEIIYLKNVTFFRNETLNKMKPIQCDVITCAAPIVGTTNQNEVKKRMENIIISANMNNIDILILGKWGCGAFGNDWNIFKSLWKEVIKSIGSNAKIVFAIPF